MQTKERTASAMMRAVCDCLQKEGLKAMVYGYLPDEQADVELAGVVGGGGGDGGAHGDAAVGLDEARAEEVVAPRRLVRVRLHHQLIRIRN